MRHHRAMKRRSTVADLVGVMQQRFGHELRIAAMGMPQRQISARAGISQSQVCRIMRGQVIADLEQMVRLTHAVGHRVSLKLYPGEGIRLRDSGQLELAEAVRSEAHRSWKINLEVPVAMPPDRRAADMILEQPAELNMLEIERMLLDVQAQLRAAQLKRAALVERLGRRVNLLLGVPDTAAARSALAPHIQLMGAALPIPSRRAWAALRSGQPIGGDALLWIRRRKSTA